MLVVLSFAELPDDSYGGGVRRLRRRRRQPGGHRCQPRRAADPAVNRRRP
jgi:hypothetical protein